MTDQNDTSRRADEPVILEGASTRSRRKISIPTPSRSSSPRPPGFHRLPVRGRGPGPDAGKAPKDFDIVTDARPGQIKKRFANVYIIGRRFRLAHIHFPGGKIIEVATFRQGSRPGRGECSRRPATIRRTPMERRAKTRSGGTSRSTPFFTTPLRRRSSTTSEASKTWPDGESGSSAIPPSASPKIPCASGGSSGTPPAGIRNRRGHGERPFIPRPPVGERPPDPASMKSSTKTSPMKPAPFSGRSAIRRPQAFPRPPRRGSRNR